MSARDEILAAVRASRPPHVDMPDSGGFPVGNGDVVAGFIAALEATGGWAVRVESDAELPDRIRDLVGQKDHVVAPVDIGVRDLDTVEVAVVRARLGVAENGAVWLSEADLGARVLPVIVPCLIVVLDADTIVSTMNEAYAALEGDMPGFGQFVAGPSKTADIEQSLVIGAHGARETTVVLVGV